MFPAKARCIAPELTTELLASYRSKQNDIAGDASDAYGHLLLIVEAHQQGQEYAVPTRKVLNSYGVTLDRLTGDARTPAFHLLWYVQELAVGRNPQESCLKK